MVNIWPNSSFESSADPWTASGGSDTPVLSTTHVYDGNLALYCRRGSGTGAPFAVARAESALTAAGDYDLSVRLWVPSSAPGSVGFRIGGAGVAPQTLYAPVRDAWVEATTTFTWDGVGIVAFYAYGTGTDPSAELWMDQLTVDDGAPPDDGGDEDDGGAQGGGSATGQALLTFEGLDLVADAPPNPFLIEDEDWWFEAAGEEFDFGDPERAVTEIVSQLIEGSVAAFGDTGNRTTSFKLRAVSPTSLGLTLAERSLIMACDTVGLKTLAYTHPDGTSPTTVFDVILADAAFEYDDLDELRCYRTWTMTLTCKPWTRSATPVVIAAANVPGEQPPEPPEDLVIEDGSVPSHFSMNQASLSFNKIGQMIVKPTTTQPTTKGRSMNNGGSLTWSTPNEYSPGQYYQPLASWARFCYGREVITPDNIKLSSFQGTRKPYLYRNINTDLVDRPFIIIEGLASTWSADYARGVYKTVKGKRYYRYSGLKAGVVNTNPDLEFRIAGQVVKPVQLAKGRGRGEFRAVLSGAGVRNASTVGVAVNVSTSHHVTETFIAIDSITLTAGKGSTLDGRMQARSLPIPGSKPAEASLLLRGYDSAGVPASLGAETLIYSSEADETDFQPPLTAYRTAGPIRSNNNSALSHASNVMTTSVGQSADDFCDTYNIPVDLLAPGTYQVLASLSTTMATNEGPHAIKSDATLQAPGTSGWPYARPGGQANSSVTVDLVSTPWRIRSIGALTLPLLAAETAPEGMTLRLRVWAPDGEVKHDTLLLCNVSTGDVTILNTADNGTLKVVGVRLNAPTSQMPAQTTWIEYDDGSIMHAGDRLIAPGVHSLAPPAAELFTVTTDNAYSTVSTEFYPRWATFAVGTPVDIDVDDGSGSGEEDVIPQGAVSGAITWAGQARGLTARSGTAVGTVTWTGKATGKTPELPSFVATFNIGDTELGTPMTATLYLGRIAAGTAIDWGDGQATEYPSYVSGTATCAHTYNSPGIYQVQLSGAFGVIGYAIQSAEAMAPLISVDDWTLAAGTTATAAAFRNTANLTSVAAPPSSVTNMTSMFMYSAFDGDLSAWDVSSVTNMTSMFRYSAFNGDISSWDVSSVTNMDSMFSNAAVFNGDISSWDVSSVTDMDSMFSNAAVFSQDLSGWDVSSVTSHSGFSTGSALTPEQLPHWPDEAT